MKCAENGSDCEDWGGYFKVYFNRTFRKRYGRHGMGKGVWCINCVIRFLEGGMAEYDPGWLKKIKRVE